ncbi:copper resistance protein CopC [Alteromonas sp. ASW11-19]|uniref:Copper resistance protein CopC n=1 Tax=Alteromonas salexigens TaxID=2982530 RepID=A0ABT2VQ00_9ALTE|nr:copper resistance CopC family protein [Alteromonas salexigens]MCU7555397.1 copper resistance protein CopC [Alteromonas salexigens]
MQFIYKIGLALMLAFSTQALAHGDVKLESSSPSDNAMLMSAPEQLTLSYTKPLRLMKVSINGKKTGDVGFDFEPKAKKQATYSWQLPVLKPDSYTVEWIAMGGDGHKMKATVSFMVH